MSQEYHKTKSEFTSALEETEPTAETCAVLFTGSGHSWILGHHAVNQSEHEWYRSVETDANQTRSELAHTQMIDRAWRTLKENILDPR